MTAATALLVLIVALLSLIARRRAFAARVLIVGTSPLARQLVTEFAAHPHLWHHVAGVVDDSSEANPLLGPMAGPPLARLGPIIKQLRPSRIVVAVADRRGRLPMRELLDATVAGVVVEDGVDCYERLTGKIAIEALAPSGLIASPAFRKSHFDLACSHALSLIAATTALVVLSPLFAALALLVKLDSPGPVFFVQDRVGLRGRRFRLLKFRTMHAADGPTSEWARDNGHRITRTGSWFRRYRIDELPQLVNVVRGELNLVGPRPHPVSNFELFTQNIPFYSLRSVVRPGLTGWAQVRQGYANGLEEETEKMRYDLYYIKHMSACLDLRILLQTVRIVLSGRQSCTPARTDLHARSVPSLREPLLEMKSRG
jgi:exopolysaccharide biosynthesis polyprenyl glycosylphosphotransferase